MVSPFGVEKTKSCEKQKQFVPAKSCSSSLTRKNSTSDKVRLACESLLKDSSDKERSHQRGLYPESKSRCSPASLSPRSFSSSSSENPSYEKAKKKVSKGIKKGPWTSREDEALIRQMEGKEGDIQWAKLRVYTNSGKRRLGNQCRNRWLQHLQPGVLKKPISDQEIKILLSLTLKYGGKWKKISKIFNDTLYPEKKEFRTDLFLKNWFNANKHKYNRTSESLLRPQSPVQQDDTPFSSNKRVRAISSSEQTPDENEPRKSQKLVKKEVDLVDPGYSLGMCQDRQSPPGDHTKGIVPVPQNILPFLPALALPLLKKEEMNSSHVLGMSERSMSDKLPVPMPVKLLSPMLPWLHVPLLPGTPLPPLDSMLPKPDELDDFELS